MRPASPRAAARVRRSFVTADSLPGLLSARAERSGRKVAFYVQSGRREWSTVTWGRFATLVERLAARFALAGLRAGDRLGILSPTCLGWEIAQFAAMRVGAIVVGIDPQFVESDIERLLNQTRVTALALGREEAVARRAGDLARFRFVVLTSENGLPSCPSVYDWVAAHPASDAGGFAAGADDPALVAFSSGTTGHPTPVVYTHRQVLLACRAIAELYPEISAKAKLVCWLPLASLFQRMINFCGIMRGLPSYLVEDPKRVMEVLPVARPEVLIAVPRFCERVQQGVLDEVRRSSGRRRAWSYAFALSRSRSDMRKTGKRSGALREIAWRLADRMVLTRVRAGFGGRLRFIVTGSAPMAHDVLDWFEAIGIPVLEAYGTSQNIVPVAACSCSERRPGTVGRPLALNEVRLAEDGEILVRGSGVFLRALDDNRALDGALDAERFLHTGDLGTIDDDGYLRLLGRKDEVFKGPDGRWVIPAEVEAVLRRMPGVGHVAAFRRSDGALVAVLALAPDARMEPQERGAGGSRATTRNATSALEDALGTLLPQLPRSSWPRACLFVRNGFSVDGGELTTNMKVRRSYIARKFRAELDALGRSGAAVPLQPIVAFA